jgi:hypothetical protein
MPHGPRCVRGAEKPYLFGHGRQFKTVKWPVFWYGAYWVLDTLSRYPGLWRGRGARPEHRRAIAEMAACLVAYNVGPDGRVVPRSCYQGFDGFSFGQKKTPSAFATARLCVILRRLGALAGDIAAVDVRSLASSKGGKGTAFPPAVSGAQHLAQVDLQNGVGVALAIVDHAHHRDSGVALHLLQQGA